MTPTTFDPTDTWWNDPHNPAAQEARHIAAGGPGCLPTHSDRNNPEGTPNPGPRPEPTGNKPPTVAATGPDQIDTTTGTPHTGAMIALVPQTPSMWAIRDGEPPDALHLTLHYLGEATDIPLDAWDLMDTTIAQLATILPPIQANVFGAAIWNPGSDTPSVVANIGDPPDDPGASFATLGTIHAAITDLVHTVADEEDGTTDWTPPAQHTPWVAHMCWAYPTGLGPALEAVDTALALMGPIVFDTLRITYGSESFDYQLSGARM